jgi:DNA-binding NarL/FixJ family response regulator
MTTQSSLSEYVAYRCAIVLADMLTHKMNTTQQPSYALVMDDHPLVCKGLCEFVRSLRVADEVLGLSSEVELGKLLVARGSPRLVLLDFWLQGSDSGHLVQRLVQLSPAPRVLVMSGDDRPAVAMQAKRYGAHGFVAKREEPAQLADAIHRLIAGLQAFPQDMPANNRLALNNTPATASLSLQLGELGLTQRQGQVLQLILQGQPNKQIAAQLDLSEHTVKQYVSDVLQALGVGSRVEAITRLAGYKLLLD